MARNVALVARASGIIGNGMMQERADQPSWDTRALATRDIPGLMRTVAIDLLVAGLATKALTAASDTTHLFSVAGYGMSMFSDAFLPLHHDVEPLDA